MVSALFVDAIARPYDTLSEIYNEHERDSFPTTVAIHFSELFRDQHIFLEIPAISIHSPPEAHLNGTLVRFSAMVQDPSSSPEMYIASFGGGKFGGWGLNHGLEIEPIDYHNLKECSTMWAVSIPGEGPWVSNHEPSLSRCTPQFPHKYPLPNVPHVGVQIKIYDTGLADSFKSTDVHNFVGILSSEPLHTTLHSDSPTLVPTLHMLYSKPLPPTLIPRTYPYSAPDESHSIRAELLDWIANEALDGDREAAEYVLLAVIARVHSRTPPILPLTLTLSNFPCSPDAQSIPALQHVLGLLIPLFIPVHLSLSYLNTTPFTPSSPQSSEISDLHSGLLQLPQGSTALVTEFGVSEGVLEQNGIVSVHALQEVIDSQHLDYAFPFHNFTFETDLGVIILSDGKKSAFFQTMVTIPIQISTRHDTDVVSKLYKPMENVQVPSDEQLGAFRAFIGSSKHGITTISEATAKYIQDDFVQECSKKRVNKEVPITSSELVVLMTLSRLFAISLQQYEISSSVWSMVKELEEKRNHRICKAYNG